MKEIEIDGKVKLFFQGAEISYVISAIFKPTKENKYSMPILEFIKYYGMEEKKLLAGWDNDNYLIETLLEKVLNPWLLEDKKIIAAQDFADLLSINGVKIDDFKGIQTLLVSASNAGFFNDYYLQKTWQQF